MRPCPGVRAVTDCLCDPFSHRPHVSSVLLGYVFAATLRWCAWCGRRALTEGVGPGPGVFFRSRHVCVFPALPCPALASAFTPPPLVESFPCGSSPCPHPFPAGLLDYNVSVFKSALASYVAALA